jgi:hypothetical protein
LSGKVESDCAYPQGITRDERHVIAKEATLGEYGQSHRCLVVPTADELGLGGEQSEIDEEEVRRLQAIWSFGAQVLGGPILPTRQRVLMPVHEDRVRRDDESRHAKARDDS